MSAHDDTEAIRAATAQHRRLAADFFEGLTEEELATPSLCSAWTVRDVLAHLVMVFQVPLWRFAVDVAAARGSADRASQIATTRVGRRSTAELVQTLRSKADEHPWVPGVGPGGQLADTAVHLRDAARPLGVADVVPAQSWRMVLDFLVTSKAQLGHVPRGLPADLALRASDLGWEHGSGARVEGPAEAVALALCGRTVALADLSGEGVVVLRQRLGEPPAAE